MELRTLATFVKVAQCNSFSKAAQELGYSQAAVTIQIQQLEQELQTTLFDRFHKHIQLSEQGTLFLLHAQEILQAVDRAKRSMNEQKEPEGHLRIGTIESLCTSLFPTLIAQYHHQYPKVSITMECGSPNQLIQLLYQNKLDLIYLLDQPIYDLHLCKVIEEQEEVVFVCAPNHPLTKKTSITLQDLCPEEWILTEANASYRCAFHDCLAQHDISISATLEVGNIDLIISLIKDSFGISFLPKSVLLPYLNNHQLVELHPQDCTFHIYRQLLYHKNKWLTSPMQAFIQMIEAS